MSAAGITMGAKAVDTTVKLRSEVVRKAKIVAAFRGLSLVEYLSETLAPVVDSHLQGHTRAETGGAGGAKSKGGARRGD